MIKEYRITYEKIDTKGNYVMTELEVIKWKY